MTAGIKTQPDKHSATAQETTTAWGDLGRRPQEDRMFACPTTTPRYLGVSTVDQPAVRGVAA